MSEANLANADPATDTPSRRQREADFREHTHTYNSFVHIIMWFLLHALLVLLGIYFMTLGNSIWGGGLLFAAGIMALVYGVVTSAVG